MEISFGITFWLTAQARGRTFLTLQQELPFAQSERRANSFSNSHVSQVSPILADGYAALWPATTSMSDAAGPDLPGVPHSSGLWRTELVRASPDLQTLFVPAPRALRCPSYPHSP